MNFVSAAETVRPLPTVQAPSLPRAPGCRHIVLIPSYNTGPRLCSTVADIRRLDWPLLVVVDGSTDGSDADLQQMSRNDPDLQVFIMPVNRGKGAAILHGLQHARARGFTHVVTVDADGQHSVDHIGELIRLSRLHPDRLVLGVPVFDATAPRIRVMGHRIGNFCAHLVTLGSGIGNSLFGFRAYPIEPLLRAFGETRWMRRFDFDSEAAIRLCWAGLHCINVPAPVRYLRREDGGVSHFRYLRDNLLLAFMYCRLLAGLLVRLPRLVTRRLAIRSSRH